MRPVARRVAFLAAALAFGLACGQANAQSKLEVSLFPSSGWVLNSGVAAGYFARQGLAIHLDPVTGSVAQITGMMDGTYDLGLTALDNVIAYDAGQGEAKLAQTPDLVVFMGGEGGALHLITAPAIKRVEDLKGDTLAVDAKTTGFAFVLYRILARHGLKPGDYSLIAAGSSQKRLDALLGGKAVGALLDRPFDSFATAKGFNDLVQMNKVFPHYQSGVGMARRAWARQHRAQLVGFIRAYVQAGRWLFDPKNKQAAIDLLIKTTPNLPRATAETIYRDTTGRGSTTVPDAALDVKGIATVVALRSEYGEPKTKLDARQFYDLSYYRAATGK